MPRYTIQTITKLMTRYLVEGLVEMINAFPSKNSISDDVSPASTLEGKQKIDMNIKRLEFGTYAMVYIKTINDIRKRSVPGIALKASNNAGGCYFMLLYTGKRIHIYIWDELPIDDEVIAPVDSLALEENKPLQNDNHPLFEWFPGHEIMDKVINESVENWPGDIDLEDRAEVPVEENLAVPEDYVDINNNLYITK